MIVTMALLQVTGKATFEVEAKDLNEAREKLRAGEGILIDRTIDQVLYNFETLTDPSQEEPENQANPH